ncbi:oxidoreductase [Streptomyces sp. NRRL F-5123]|uniref:oxidoreductase n=1 Tax=Streptomyces sp. NRRL F-5123 TaxID=1463856 RepID=UPI0004E1C02B|nr:oxidoreductase [Streptomyces sp. NRRL F-5123]
MTRESRWRADQMPDQDGRVFVVTGANSGLGLATTRALARKGARVVLAVRDEEKGRRAAAQLTSEQARARLEVRPLDLSDMASVRAFADGLKADGMHPDVLVNNAGLMAPPRTLTADGHEVQFAANHLGHFALTALLLELMAGSDDPRVVTVTSANHRQGQIFFDDLTGERKYAPMGYYNQSKLANALFGWELHRRLSAAGSRVRSVLAHPGYSSTGLQTSAPVGRVKFVFGRLLLPLAQTSEQGALPQLYAATDPQARGGELYGPDGMGELRGAPKRVELAPRATDPAAAGRLWQLSEELTGVSFALPAVV